MIKPAENAIMLVLNSGELIPFEPEKLQGSIARSFIASGIRDSYLAEDIALAVEFALVNSPNPDKIFAISELNATVVRILEASGYPETAQHHKRHNACVEISSANDPAIVEKLLQRHLALYGHALADITGKVVDAAARLGITLASPTLYVELGRYFQTANLVPEETSPLKIPRHNRKAPWLVELDALSNTLSKQTSELVEKNIIGINGISSLFPSLRLELRFLKLAAHLQFEPVITEMMLLPYFKELADGLNDCARHSFELAGDNTMPVFLNIPDMSLFAVKYLDAEWPEARKDCREMLSHLIRHLDFNVFRTRLN